jgi:hypothetical protein
MPLLSYGVVGGCSVGVPGQVFGSAIAFESDFSVGVLDDVSNFLDLG